MTRTVSITITALMTALLCIAAPLTIPVGAIPVSLTPMILYIFVYVFGWKKTFVSFFIYLAMGAMGLPVFSGFQGGLHKITGPTGGYLVGFLLLTAACGFFCDFFKRNACMYVAGMILGILCAYVFGSIWYMVIMEQTLKNTLIVCVIPFLPFDAMKIVASLLIAPRLKKSMSSFFN